MWGSIFTPSLVRTVPPIPRTTASQAPAAQAEWIPWIRLYIHTPLPLRDHPLPEIKSLSVHRKTQEKKISKVYNGRMGLKTPGLLLVKIVTFHIFVVNDRYGSTGTCVDDSPDKSSLNADRAIFLQTAPHAHILRWTWTSASPYRAQPPSGTNALSTYRRHQT